MKAQAISNESKNLLYALLKSRNATSLSSLKSEFREGNCFLI